MSKKINGILLMIVGVVLMVFSLAADSMGIGDGSGINGAQILVAVFGFILIIIGLWLFTLNKQLPLEKINPFIKKSTSQRIFIALLILGLGVAAIFFFNNLFPRIDIEEGKLNNKDFYLPYSGGIGGDFRLGIYRPPQMLLDGVNIYETRATIYPPFVNLFFMPLQLFEEFDAYIFFVIILFFTNILSVGLAAVLFKEVLLDRLGLAKDASMLIALFLFFAMLIYTLTSYSFMLMVDRANYDSIAILLALLAVYLSIKKPESLWLQVILLSIATHLKIYPAVLFIILFLKHGKKMILPAVLVNIVLLLSLGLNNAWLFFQNMFRFTESSFNFAISNHSGDFYARFLVRRLPKVKALFPVFSYLFKYLPVVIWGVSCYYIIRNLKFEKRALMILMVSIPLMCMFPAVSHDYKLIIMSISFVIMTGLSIYKVITTSRLWDYGLLAVILVLLFFIGRSFVLLPASMALLMVKYPFLLTTAILMLMIVYHLKEDDRSIAAAEPAG